MWLDGLYNCIITPIPTMQKTPEEYRHRIEKKIDIEFLNTKVNDVIV